MRVPVIRGKIGKWRYYTGTLTFEQVKERVSPSINDLYPSDSLSKLLQRELTDNYLSIKEYIKNDDERFFNALILAIYNGDPQWLEVEFDGEYDEIYNIGFLDFPEDAIIFPVDGQHRVAGIIAALEDTPELYNEQIPVVFIAHEDSPRGVKRTRKLFSTLNRRAKPVGENAQIALDEDDVVAIATREIITTCSLFWGNRLSNTKGKQIPSQNKDAITSLVTLYQCNSLLTQNKLGLKGKKYKDFLLYRPEENIINDIIQYLSDFWELFSQKLDSIQEYLSVATSPAESFRYAEGGNIIFRPVALTEFVKAAIEIADRHDGNYELALSKLNTIKMELSSAPWKGILWDGKKIITRADKTLIRLMILRMCGSEYLDAKNSATLLDRYISATNFDGDRSEIRSFFDSL